MTDKTDATTTTELTEVPSKRDGDASYTTDDLIDLVRAVKFAHTDMSMRKVHEEISNTMANSDRSYAFLKDVKLNDVKKVWKKALKGGPKTGADNANEGEKKKEANNDAKQPKTVTAKVPSSGNEPIVSPADGILKFYTVGDGSVKTLAQDYAKHHAEAAVAANKQHNDDSEKEMKGKYTHFFLDVPADLSGSRPHQALINYQDNQRSSSSASGGKGKKKGKFPQQSNDASDDRNGNNSKTGIFKIQLAALPPGMEDFPTPMLLYNKDRSAKTFLHPPTSTDDEDDDGGYLTIKKMITDSGVSGALGATGGQKAYFYGFVTKTKSGPGVISIDLESGLVPSQSW